MEVETFRNDLLPAIERWQAAGEAIAVATVVNVDGTAPRREGSKLVASAGVFSHLVGKKPSCAALCA